MLYIKSPEIINLIKKNLLILPNSQHVYHGITAYKPISKATPMG